MHPINLTSSLEEVRDKRHTLARMTEKRRSPRWLRFSAIVWLSFLTLSISTMIFVGRLTSRIMADIIVDIDQSAINQPRMLTTQTIRNSSPTQSQNLPSTNVNEEENQDETSSANIESSHERQASEENHAAEDLIDRQFRYKLGLVRLIGNPIAPKQDENQTLRNLEFLLENEPKFDTTVDKHWILNRIADDDYKRQIKRILRLHNQSFSVLPFDIQEYDSKPYRYTEASKKILRDDWKDREVDLLRSRSFWKGDGDEASRKEMNRKRKEYFDEVYKEKYLYVTNQNNARNYALGLYHGKTKKKTEFEIDYVLPWDGDCFLSQSAHDSLHRDLERHNDEQQQRITDARIRFRREMRADDDVSDSFDIDIDDDFVDYEISNMIGADSMQRLINAPIKYFYTPVEQFVDIDDAPIDPSEKKSNHLQNEEDLQLILHRSGKATFDRKSSSMVWMLKKLKIKGTWNQGIQIRPEQKDYNFFPLSFGEDSNEGATDFESSFLLFKNEDVESPAVGWVSRLDAGESSDKTGAVTSQREGITLFCRNLDTQAVNQIHYKLNGTNHEVERNNVYLFYNERILKKEARGVTDDTFDRLIQHLIEVADLLKEDRTYYEPSMHSQFPVEKFLFESTILGLAYELTGDVEYAKHATENIRSFFLNPKTRLYEVDGSKILHQSGSDDSSGEIKYVDQAPREHRTRLNVVDFKSASEFLQQVMTIKSPIEFATTSFNDVYFFLDAVRMVEKSGELSESEIGGVRDWFRQYLDQLVNSGGEFGNAAYYENDHRGLYYDIQLISIAAFTGNQRLAVRIAHESVSRLIGQAHKFERAVEKGNTECSDDLVFTLQGWITLARIVSNYLGIDLWKELPLKRSLNDDPGSKKTKNQPFLCRAGEYAVIMSTKDSNFCSAHDSDEDEDEKKIDYTEWSPIHWTAQHWDCPAPWKFVEDGLSHYAQQPVYPASHFHTHGIAPFWNLGLA